MVPRHALRGVGGAGRRGVRRYRARAQGALRRVVDRVLPPLRVPAPPEEPPPPPEELVEFLRLAGLALCRGGDATGRVIEELQALAAAYGAEQVRFFVLPTGVFVRVGAGAAARVDFEPASGDPLRLDQIGALYAFVDHAKKKHVPPLEGSERIREILAAPPRFGGFTALVGQCVLTIGLGLAVNPSVRALLGFAVLGLFVGVLRRLAQHFTALALALPVAAALLISLAAYEVGGSWLKENPAHLIIPPLAVFLPGAALTIGTVDLATGAMVAGASRLVQGLNMLVLLAFGIFVGVELASVPEHIDPGTPLGWWAPWLGVLVFGLGHYLASPAPPGSFPWLIVVLYVVWGAQLAASQIGGSLLGAFAGGLALIPLSRFVEARPEGPPSQVTFLPAFWLLVPGALGLTGVSELVLTNAAGGAAQFVTALLTVVAIALGVLVGSSALRQTAADRAGM